MKVAVWQGGPRFTVEQRPDPTPGSGQVVVKVDTVGVCGTDVHITQGLFPATPPQILGHEFSGTVVAAGPRGLDVSRDDGASWTSLNTQVYWAVGFASPRAGWAVGPGGRITKVSF